MRFFVIILIFYFLRKLFYWRLHLKVGGNRATLLNLFAVQLAIAGLCETANVEHFSISNGHERGDQRKGFTTLVFLA